MKSKLPKSKSTVKAAPVSPAQLSAQLKSHVKTFHAAPYWAGDRGVIESIFSKLGIQPSWSPHADAVKRILAEQMQRPAQFVADNGELKAEGVGSFRRPKGDNE